MTIPPPRDLGLPYEHWWPYQASTIAQAVEAFESGHRYVLLGVPTGGGKTGIAAAIARLLKAKTVDLTATIQLQEQKAREIPGAVTCRGRKHFPCPLFAHVMADDAPCVGEGCPEGLDKPGSSCPYYRQLGAALRAPYTCVNYALWYLYEPAFLCSLLVCDEAHLMEDQLIGAATVEIPGLQKHRDDWREYLLEMKARLRPGKLRRQVTSALALKDPVALRGNAVGPVWPSMAKIRRARRVLFMTATPGDPEIFRKIVDLPDLVYIEQPSTFPAGNRPVIYSPVARLSHRDGDSGWEAVARAVERIAQRFPESKGIVHVSSWRQVDLLQRLVQDDLTRRRLVSRMRVEEFAASKRPVILISPSLHTGLDLPYVFTFQVIAKVPWPDIGDPGVSARLESPLGREWYENKALTTVIQAAGRAMRRPDDVGVTYILDKTYDRLHRLSKPVFYKEAFIAERV